jgi:tRNA-dihydrouridine synthase
VHLRTKQNSSQEPAQVFAMGALASSVGIPVLANGDMYTRDDMRSVMAASPRGAAGVMLGRPLLLNPSLLRHLRPPRGQDNTTAGTRQDTQEARSSCEDRAAETPSAEGEEEGGGSSEMLTALDLDANCLPIRMVIKDFLLECIRYEPPFQVCYSPLLLSSVDFLFNYFRVIRL